MYTEKYTQVIVYNEYKTTDWKINRNQKRHLSVQMEGYFSWAKDYRKTTPTYIQVRWDYIKFLIYITKDVKIYRSRRPYWAGADAAYLAHLILWALQSVIRDACLSAGESAKCLGFKKALFLLLTFFFFFNVWSL